MARRTRRFSWKMESPVGHSKILHRVLTLTVQSYLLNDEGVPDGRYLYRVTLEWQSAPDGHSKVYIGSSTDGSDLYRVTHKWWKHSWWSLPIRSLSWVMKALMTVTLTAYVGPSLIVHIHCIFKITCDIFLHLFYNKTLLFDIFSCLVACKIIKKKRKRLTELFN